MKRKNDIGHGIDSFGVAVNVLLAAAVLLLGIIIIKSFFGSDDAKPPVVEVKSTPRIPVLQNRPQKAH